MKLRLLSSLVLAIGFFPANAFSQQRDGGPTGAFSYSKDPSTASTQHTVKAVVERYQAALDAGDFATIKGLFAPDAIAEWNTKETMVGPDAMAAPYAELFSTTTFSTDFQFDAVDVYGDIGIVRTHHPIGQTEVDKKTHKKTLDFNREIFVLRRLNGEWKIILYTFSAQPKQGEQ